MKSFSFLFYLAIFFILFSESLFSQAPTTGTNRPPVLINKSPNTPEDNDRTQPEEVEQDDDVIRIEATLVTIPVIVTDRYGRFITDLRKEDFQVFEDNLPQRIEYFASVEEPFTVILLIDVSGSTKEKLDEIKQAAISFIDQLRNDDKASIWAFSDRIDILCLPTSNKSSLRSAIMNVHSSGGTCLYDAVMYALREAEQIDGKKAIVLFTDGVESCPRSINEKYLTLRKAEESSAMIYAIRYDTYSDVAYTSGRRSILDILLGNVLGGGSGTTAREYEIGKKYLQELAFVSSGRYYESNITNLRSAFAIIAEELRRQYTLGYYPENLGRVGQRKFIRVKVMRPGLVVKAKNSYIVGQKNNVIPDKRPTLNPRQTVQSTPQTTQPNRSSQQGNPQQNKPPQVTPSILRRLPF